MPGNPQAISKKTWLGAALEATAFTAANTTNIKYIPTKSVMNGTQHFEDLDEERNTVDTPNDRQATTREGACDPKGQWYNDTTPLFLWSLLGSPNTTQPDAAHAATVYKHAIQLQDTPPTLTLWKNYHQVKWYAPGAHCEKIQFKWDAKKLLEADASLKHLFPVDYAGSALTPSFSTLKPFSGYMPTITTADSLSSDIEEMTVTIERMADPWFGAAGGSPDILRWDYGERKAEIEFTARFDTDAIWQRYKGKLDDAITVDFRGVLIVNSGGSGTPPNTDYFQELQLVFPVVGYDTCVIDTGKKNVLVKVKATCRPDSSGLLSGFVQNTVAAYTAS